VAAGGRSVVGSVKSTAESVREGLSRGMKTGTKVHCLDVLVGLSWLLLAVCVLCSRPCSAGSSRLRREKIPNDWMEMSKVRKVLC